MRDRVRRQALQHGVLPARCEGQPGRLYLGPGADDRRLHGGAGAHDEDNRHCHLQREEQRQGRGADLHRQIGDAGIRAADMPTEIQHIPGHHQQGRKPALEPADATRAQAQQQTVHAPDVEEGQCQRQDQNDIERHRRRIPQRDANRAHQVGGAGDQDGGGQPGGQAIGPAPGVADGIAAGQANAQDARQWGGRVAQLGRGQDKEVAVGGALLARADGQ